MSVAHALTAARVHVLGKHFGTRGIGFTYGPHRVNVATSRARGVVIVVASPALFEADCRTPEQMRWASGLCRYREIAEDVTRLVRASAAAR